MAASIFTFEHAPPRVSSPWTVPATLRLAAVDEAILLGGLMTPPPVRLADCGMVKLEAEPENGPTEYKLHLLLRPRRHFSASSTGGHVSGSWQSRTGGRRSESGLVVGGEKASPIVAPIVVPIVGPIVAPTLQSRQNRLQHLTTQLLWRLQQSSPYHSSSTADLVLPLLPEDTPKLGEPARSQRLLPGLEESQGALYEIGVSDDGTFVGLARDEMDESLVNLRVMAASLGCRVEVLRTVIVGDCQWVEPGPLADAGDEALRRDHLWVAEALVLPDTKLHPYGQITVTPLTRHNHPRPPARHSAKRADTHTEQLRVSLTGSTTSGKSSLLGTLSTSTLDNGRGKSRLSLLKHRHEIASGVTSSVAPELIGYETVGQGTGGPLTGVINYGCGNVSSWNDVHSAAEGGRLVLLTDSAGHPRYRRTAVRGLVSWAPHWTLCCIAADDGGDVPGLPGAAASSGEVLRTVASQVDLSLAHLALCLKLDLSLVVIITKYDLASKTGLRQTLSRVLTAAKAAGRVPHLLKPGMRVVTEVDLRLLPADEDDEVKLLLANSQQDGSRHVPILLTSAVTGMGITKLHSILRHLPIPASPESARAPTTKEETGIEALFHVDEIFWKSEGANGNVVTNGGGGKIVPVLGGHLQYGYLSIGDEVLVGPFAPEPSTDDAGKEMHRARSYPARLSASARATDMAFARQRARSGDFTSHDAPFKDPGVGHSGFPGEWQRVRIASVRNLRLPVRTLLAGQVGTTGIELGPNTSLVPKLRKGMIVAKLAHAGDAPEACGAFRALFSEDDYHIMEPGSLFIIYVSSIRAPAKIVAVESVAPPPDSPPTSDSDSAFAFEGEYSDRDWAEEQSAGGKEDSKKRIEVLFELANGREWIEVGAQVLVMPGNAVEGSVGLEGFVGSVTGLVARI